LLRSDTPTRVLGRAECESTVELRYSRKKRSVRQGPPVVGIGASGRRHIRRKLGLLPALV
jgi:hypothetical protein